MSGEETFIDTDYNEYDEDCYYESGDYIDEEDDYNYYESGDEVEDVDGEMGIEESIRARSCCCTPRRRRTRGSWTRC